MKGRLSYGLETGRVMATLIAEKIRAREIRAIEEVFAQMNVKDLAELSGITKGRLSYLKADWSKLRVGEQKALAEALGISGKQFRSLSFPSRP
jgi:hypothetical protein